MYSFSVTVNKSFDEAVETVTAELMKEGFGILTEIDFAGTIKKKLDIDRPAYKILGACNPPLANQAVTADDNAGVLLPCNVVVRDNENDSCDVVFMDPMAVISLSDNADVASVAKQANERLMRVKAALQG
ncbi:MAG: DUF302 domain-containing protein [Gammaproteobacteria bacterium]|nr:DUF302 domain-containing protein [Gammaproteobacteria bacterium]